MTAKKKKDQVHVEYNGNNVDGAIRNYSVYLEDEQKRVIDKNFVNGGNLSSVVKESAPTCRALIKKSLVFEEDPQDSSRLIVKEPEGSYISLPRDFHRKLIRKFNTKINLVYYWLKRRYDYCRSQGKPCLFTKTQICEEVLGVTPQGKNRLLVEDILMELSMNGLIEFRIVRRDKTFFRELLWYAEDFNRRKDVVKSINKVDTNVPGMRDAFKEEMDEPSEKEVKVLYTIGYSDELIKALDDGTATPEFVQQEMAALMDTIEQFKESRKRPRKKEEEKGEDEWVF